VTRAFSIVVAWDDSGDPYRRASVDWTRTFWACSFPDAELVVGHTDPFTRASALNVAVEQARHDLILQADPDSIVAAGQARAALDAAAREDGLVVAFERYLYLGEDATRDLLSRDPCDRLPSFAPGDCHDHGLEGLGNVTAYSRRTWERAGGYDERFGLWGGDDAAFAYACAAFLRPTRRVPGDMLHAYHPRLPQSVPGDPEYVRQFAILAEYRDAAAVGSGAVRALVVGGRSR